MKRSLSFPSEQLLGWKANSPPRCLPSPRCVFSEIHTGFSVEVSGIYLEPLQPEPPWCRAVGECVCVSVSECVCVYLFPAKGEMDASSKLSYGLLEVSQISNNWKRFFFFRRPYESRCGVSGGGGWERKKKSPSSATSARRPELSPAPSCLPLPVSPSVRLQVPGVGQWVTLLGGSDPEMSTLLPSVPDGNQVSCLMETLSDLLFTLSRDSKAPRPYSRSHAHLKKTIWNITIWCRD